MRSSRRYLLAWCVMNEACGRIGFQSIDPVENTDLLDAGVSPVGCAAAIPKYEQGACVASSPWPVAAALTVTLPAPVAASHVLVVAVDYDSASASPTFTDSLGNAFHAVSPISRSAVQSSLIAYAPITVAGPDTVRVEMTALTGGIGLHVHEYSGLSPTAPLDAFAYAVGDGVQLMTGEALTTAPYELVFAHGVIVSTVELPGTGFTARQTCNGNMTEDSIGVEPGGHAAGFTADIADRWISSVATFRPAGCP